MARSKETTARRPGRPKKAQEPAAVARLTAETADECGLDKLREAIVMQAIEDYKDALFTAKTTWNYAKRERAKIQADSCEVFFRGAWFQKLTGGTIDGETVIAALKKQQ